MVTNEEYDWTYLLIKYVVLTLSILSAYAVIRLVVGTQADMLNPFRLDNNPLSSEDAIKVLTR